MCEGFRQYRVKKDGFQISLCFCVPEVDYILHQLTYLENR